MKLYYQDDWVQIFHGDCRDILPELPKVDLVITDPPYGIGEASGENKSRSNLGVAKDYGKDDWDDEPVNFRLLWELLTLGKHSICFGGNYYPMPPTSCILVWDKDNGSTDFADCELAWTNLPQAVRKFKWRWQGMLQEHGGRNKEQRVHPTQKPLALIKWCISQAQKHGEIKTILDPFAGSGTTGRASKDMQIKCTLIEREEKYCEISAKRMQQEILPLEF